MPLFGHRLFRSDLYEHTNGEQFKVAVKLWWEAWNQCPAGSLPNDDAKLCRLADLGRDMKSWRRMREAVLRGFVLCSDGRLYHKLICEWATEAFERRVRDRERKKRWRNNRGGDGDGPVDNSPSPRSRDGDMDTERRGQDGLSQSHSASRPRRVPDERRGEDRRGQERRESKKDSFLFSSRGTGPSEPPEAMVGPAATSAVVHDLRKSLRFTGFAPGWKAKRDAQEQINTIAPPRPKPAYATPEQLAILRRRRA